MHITQILLTALTATSPTIDAPPDAPPDFTETIEHTEFYGTETEAQFIAFDAHGEVIGTIALWIEDDGRLVLASDYADGYAETVVADDHASTEANLPPSVIRRRANAMVNTLEVKLDISAPGRVQQDAVGCALATAAAAGACSPPSVATGVGIVACAAAVYVASCACLPLVDIDPSCPKV